MIDATVDPGPQPSLTDHLMAANASLDRAHATVDAFEDRLFGSTARPTTGALTTPPPTHTLAEVVRKSADALSERLAALTAKL